MQILFQFMLAISFVLSSPSFAWGGKGSPSAPMSPKMSGYRTLSLIITEQKKSFNAENFERAIQAFTCILSNQFGHLSVEAGGQEFKEGDQGMFEEMIRKSNTLAIQVVKNGVTENIELPSRLHKGILEYLKYLRMPESADDFVEKIFFPKKALGSPVEMRHLTIPRVSKEYLTHRSVSKEYLTYLASLRLDPEVDPEINELYRDQSDAFYEIDKIKKLDSMPNRFVTILRFTEYDGRKKNGKTKRYVSFSWTKGVFEVVNEWNAKETGIPDQIAIGNVVYLKRSGFKQVPEGDDFHFAIYLGEHFGTQYYLSKMGDAPGFFQVMTLKDMIDFWGTPLVYELKVEK